MPRGGTDKVTVDLDVVDTEGETVLRLKNQALSQLEKYALTTMGKDFHLVVVNGNREDPEAYAQ